MEENFDPLFQRLSSLCTLPTIATQVIRVAEDKETGSRELLELIEKDPAVATRLLKLVNSSYCALPNEVADLGSAITLLGDDSVRNLAVAVSVASVFKNKSSYKECDPHWLWDHSVCVATLSRVIAKQQGCCDPEEAYLVGLLHDFGLIFFCQFLDDLLPKVFEQYRESNDFLEAEKTVVGFDHLYFGAEVAKNSGMPERVYLAIQHCEKPSALPDQENKLAHVVHVANYLATRFGHNAFESHRQSAPEEEILEVLGLTLTDLRDLWDNLDANLNGFQEMSLS